MASVRSPAMRSALVLQRSATMHRGTVICFANGKATVKFTLPKQVPFGQSVAIVGNKADLGSWDPSSCLSMEWSEGDEWTAEAQLPVGEEIEYKYLIRTKDGVLEWQPGGNMKLALPDSAAPVVVLDDWSGEKRAVQLASAAEVPAAATASAPAAAPALAPAAAQASTAPAQKASQRAAAPAKASPQPAVTEPKAQLASKDRVESSAGPSTNSSSSSRAATPEAAPAESSQGPQAWPFAVLGGLVVALGVMVALDPQLLAGVGVDKELLHALELGKKLKLPGL